MSQLCTGARQEMATWTWIVFHNKHHVPPDDTLKADFVHPDQAPTHDSPEWPLPSYHIWVYRSHGNSTAPGDIAPFRCPFFHRPRETTERHPLRLSAHLGPAPGKARGCTSRHGGLVLQPSGRAPRHGYSPAGPLFLVHSTPQGCTAPRAALVAPREGKALLPLPIAKSKTRAVMSGRAIIFLTFTDGSTKISSCNRFWVHASRWSMSGKAIRFKAGRSKMTGTELLSTTQESPRSSLPHGLWRNRSPAYRQLEDALAVLLLHTI